MNFSGTQCSLVDWSLLRRLYTLPSLSPPDSTTVDMLHPTRATLYVFPPATRDQIDRDGWIAGLVYLSAGAGKTDALL